jgi:hypothetical protein
LILTVVIEVTVGMWQYMGGGCVLFSNGARFGILYYKLIVDKRCGIQKKC